MTSRKHRRSRQQPGRADQRGELPGGSARRSPRQTRRRSRPGGARPGSPRGSCRHQRKPRDRGHEQRAGEVVLPVLGDRDHARGGGLEQGGGQHSSEREGDRGHPGHLPDRRLEHAAEPCYQQDREGQVHRQPGPVPSSLMRSRWAMASVADSACARRLGSGRLACLSSSEIPEHRQVRLLQVRLACLALISAGVPARGCGPGPARRPRSAASASSR